MRSCPPQPGAAAATAAAAAAAAISILSHRHSKGNPSARGSHRPIFDEIANTRRVRTPTLTPTMIQDLQKPTSLDFWRRNHTVPWLVSSTKCESSDDNDSIQDTIPNGRPTTASVIDGTQNQNPKIDYYYLKRELKDSERPLLDSHAVFGALLDDGLIERFNVYQRVSATGAKQLEHSASSKREMVVADIKLGTRLNGHGGIVHGGIVSLLFDEAMGWAHECLEEEGVLRIDDSSTIAVTANLTVDFRAPFRQDSEAVIRVYHEETKGRKIFFSATLESKDGTVLFAEAKSLFILIGSKL